MQVTRRIDARMSLSYFDRSAFYIVDSPRVIEEGQGTARRVFSVEYKALQMSVAPRLYFLKPGFIRPYATGGGSLEFLFGGGSGTGRVTRFSSTGEVLNDSVRGEDLGAVQLGWHFGAGLKIENKFRPLFVEVRREQINPRFERFLTFPRDTIREMADVALSLTVGLEL